MNYTYILGLTSEESNHEIETHLETCKECDEYLDEMKQSFSVPKVEMKDKVYLQFT